MPGCSLVGQVRHAAMAIAYNTQPCNFIGDTAYLPSKHRITTLSVSLRKIAASHGCHIPHTARACKHEDTKLLELVAWASMGRGHFVVKGYEA